MAPDETWEDGPFSEEAEDKGSITPAAYQADHPRRADVFFALGTGLLVVLLHLLWRFPCIHPALWPDLAVAAGLRPPESICPGVWRALALCLFRLLPFDGALIAIRASGIVAAGLTAMLAYLLARETLSAMVRQFQRSVAWRAAVAPLTSFTAAVILACGEPVWVAGQSFSPAGIFLLELVAATLLLLRQTRLGGVWRLPLSMFLFGFLSGEYAFGIPLTIGAVFAYRLVLAAKHGGSGLDATPVALSVASWFAGAASSVVLTTQSFVATQGLAAFDLATSAIPVRYALSYVRSAVSSANMLGWIGFAALAGIPFALAALYARQALDEDRPATIGLLGTLGVLFAFALSQLSLVSHGWYWRWSDQVAVHSPVLLVLSTFLSAATVVFSLSAIGFNFSCRAADNEKKRQADDHVFALFIVVILLLTVPGRYGGLRRRAMGALQDYVREVARECGAVRWVFTDGALDEGVELASLRLGRPVAALSMVSGAGPHAGYIRNRGVKTEEERLALRESATSALKAWKHDFPRNLANSAVQFGFELWRQNRELPPPCSGLVARPAGFPPGEAERGVETAEKLGERILDLCEANVFDWAADPFVEEKLVRVLWRLARMARTRAVAADLAGNTAEALREADFAEALDKANPSLQSLNTRIGKAGIRALRAMSPREHLLQALQRADFTAAKPYADAVLVTDPGNADANFAIGMFYFVDELYSKAAVYLERCTRRRPDEPTFFNNLAIAQLMTHKLDLAEENARRALELLPDSPEVKDTVRQIEKARQEALLRP